MNNDIKTLTREPYIDFMRALGLLLLVGVHVNAPEWYKPMRSFDVPLMVAISAMCYKPLRGGYLQYFIKRLKRIYFPVLAFLTIFFALSLVGQCMVGKPSWSISSIIGSYLMLNQPSIGYVWIMRVFLLMALLMPFLDNMFRKSSFVIYLLAIFGVIALQSPLITVIGGIPNKYLNFVVDEIILYAFGYTALAILGLRLSKLQKKQVLIVALMSGMVILLFIGINGWTFNPQAYKYPPQSLYLLYGIFASTVLWMFKPLLSKVTDSRFFQYLSRESMWVYLWHIVPVYALTPWMDIPGLWFARYLIVVAVAILLNILWHQFLRLFPDKIAKTLG